MSWKRLLVLFCLGLIHSQFGWAAADWGTQQVQQMLADRPSMATYTTIDGLRQTVGPDDRIYQLAVQYFNGALTGKQVLWRSDSPSVPCEWADHVMSPTAGIRVALQKKCSTVGGNSIEDLDFNTAWSVVFYEFENIGNDGNFQQIFNQARAGALSRCEWMIANTKLEFAAANQLRNFYGSEFETWADEHSYPADREVWQFYLPNSYVDWIQEFQDPQGYPWNYWGQFFTQNIISHLQQVGTAVPDRACPDLPLTFQ